TSEFTLDLAEKLLNRDERFDRIVIDKKIENRESYFQALPTLLERSRKTQERMLKTWGELRAEDNADNRKKIRSKFRKQENTLRANFPKFFFKLKVYEEHIDDAITKDLGRISRINRDLDRARKPKTQRDARINADALKLELEEIHDKHRLDPEKLVRLIGDVRKHLKDAHRAKTEMVEA
ncbi:MAG TPA: RNA polymerase subunit sigma, partial [Opitutae bacterium]|nr:RNA polymerase subunit sigma [Opitutae bacterium]